MAKASAQTSMSDGQFHERALSGGATRRALDGHEVRGGVDPGFAVGGAKNGADKSFPEHPAMSPDDFTPAVVRTHLDAIKAHFGAHDPDVHQGAWVENGKVVLDASDVFTSKAAAKVAGYQRGERAIYDMKSGQDIPLARRAVK